MREREWERERDIFEKGVGKSCNDSHRDAMYLHKWTNKKIGQKNNILIKR